MAGVTKVSLLTLNFIINQNNYNMKTIIKIIILLVICFFVYKAGYRNGETSTPLTVKNATESIVQTADEAMSDVNEVFADSTNAATDAKNPTE